MSLRIERGSEPIPGYTLIDRIGSGGFGEVWKAEAPGQLLKAIKIIHGNLIDGDQDGHRQAEQELKAIQRVQKIRHPYLLSLERYDVIDGRLLIVMELADCNLWERFRTYRDKKLPGIPRGELLKYMEESAEVLDMMFDDYQLQHLDIKPQNLFLVYNHIKVADFGLVKDLENMVAVVTGGVTPVYAAPETFRNQVTRYCDQYSLAIVYQELLVGKRPFNGTTPHMLLNQHLNHPPDVSFLPASDRAIVNRALAKKPEDRFPSCLDFVRSLAAAGSTSWGTHAAYVPPGSGNNPRPQTNTPGAGGAIIGGGQDTPRTEMGPREAGGFSSMGEMTVMPMRIAPPEVTGDGCLMPAILIGLGGYGAAVLSEFRHQLTDRYGPMEHLPSTKLIWIDTDAEAVGKWTALDGTRGMHPDDAVVAPLNRPSHYIKPRRAGRSLIDGWFDPQMLYRTQRNPTTQGVRALGRLAWCDHYRVISRKIRDHLEAAVQPDALSQTQRQTGQTLRTNRPRVYIVADLGGGTGGGTFLDAAYTVRHKMLHLGYGDPQVVGIFHLPVADRRSLQSGRLVNCYASLRELNHFSSPDTTYQASFEDDRGDIRDPDAPFTRFYLFSQADGAVAGFARPQQSQNATKAGDSPANVAEFLRRDLFTMLGRTVDEDRGSVSGPDTAELCGLAVGQAAFVWPRQEILSQGASWLFETILGRWLSSDPGQIREPVRRWLGERWSEESLSPEALISQLQAACEKNLGKSPEAFFVEESQPFVPRGWFARLPDAARVWQTMLRFQDLVGMPDEHCVQRPVGQFEAVLQTAADGLIRSALPRVQKLALMLIEHPDYRVIGAEEFIEQTGAMLDSMLRHYQPLFQDLSRKAAEAYYRIQNHIAADASGVKLTPAEVGDQVSTFPRFRYQHLVLRQLCRIYSEIRIRLGDQIREVRFCRQRLEEIARRVREGRKGPALNPDLLLLAPGCYSMAEALESLRGTIAAADVQHLDGLIGDVLQKEFGSLFQVCMNPAQTSLLESLILEAIRKFLSQKLGSANLRAMFESRFPTMDHAVSAIRGVYEMARPPMLPPNTRPDRELAILAIPDGAESEVFCQIARKALPQVDLIPTHSTDEIVICRESSRVVLTDLPQLGTIAEDAYRVLAANPQSSPHARIDIAEWLDIEVESN